MNRNWLLLDVNYLAYRSFFSTGGLSHEGQSTGTIYGVLRDIENFQDRFGTSHVAFCFDYGRGKRMDICPTYKSTRRAKVLEPDEQKALDDMRRQVDMLRTTYLKQMGFGNVFYDEGYEADDVIAAVAQTLPSGDKAVVITGDQDLYQLLSDRISVWHPVSGKYVNPQSFLDEYGVNPKSWVNVKCLAGCTSDDVEGLRGIGEKTAAKYINGTLTKGVKYELLRTSARMTVNKNKPLVQLPFPGIRRFMLEEDGPPDLKARRELLTSLGITSLKESAGG